MEKVRFTGSLVLAALGLFSANIAHARENILTGDITIGYDYQERNYDDEELELADAQAQQDVEEEEEEDRTGDSRSPFVTPRIRFSSRSQSDQLAFSYAPTFSYEDVDNTHNVGHNLTLDGEKNLTKNWLVSATDHYFYGDDPVELRATDTASAESSQTASSGEQQGGTDQELSTEYGRREYWRNDFGVNTDYTYFKDSIVGFGYNYGVLRNVDDDENGYTDYDRHEGVSRLSYRFTRFWQVETQASLVKGTYEEDAVDAETIASSDTVDTDNQDFNEYHGIVRLNYDWHAHDRFFTRYSYAASEYDSLSQEDSAIHNSTIGWEHDFNSQLNMIVSAGPTWVVYDESSSESGYNAFASLAWNSQKSSLSLTSLAGYDYQNFDGNSTGLRKVWRSELGYAYRFTPQLQLMLSAGYENVHRSEPLTTSVTSTDADVTLSSENDSDPLRYVDDTYDAGIALRYNILEWLTVNASYQFTDYQSDLDGDYDEHRVLLSFTATQEFLRW